MDIKKAAITLHEALCGKKKWYDGCYPTRAHSGKHKGKEIIIVYATKKPSEFEQVPPEWEMVAEHFPIVLQVDE